MARRIRTKMGSSFLVVAMAAILVSGGILAACSRAQTTTSAPVPTTASAPTRTTTSAPTPTTTSAPAPTTTSAPTPTGVSAADYYKANVVTVVVPYGPGGGVDFTARLFANYWTQVTGGRMIVDNRAGAGGITGGNYAYAAKPDGLTLGLGISGAGLISPTLALDPAMKFDIKKMTWIEATGPEGYAMGISPKLPYTSMESLSKVSGIKFGSSARYQTGSFSAAIVSEFFGLKDARIVLGYAGSAEAFLALAKGEVDAYVTGTSGLLDAAGKGFTKPFLAFDSQRSAVFPDVPTIPELLKLSPEQENLLKTFTAFNVSYVFWYQPGVPQDRIEFVRNAFDKIAANPSFVAQGKTIWPIYVPPVGGKDFTAEMDKTLAVVTPEKYNKLTALVDKYVR